MHHFTPSHCPPLTPHPPLQAAPGSYFLMNEGESVGSHRSTTPFALLLSPSPLSYYHPHSPFQVGLALSVSLIVLLLLCGGTLAGLKWHPSLNHGPHRPVTFLS